jgi:5-methyltetrahydropteroyltriglutamate--homocysteine methyltransferase
MPARTAPPFRAEHLGSLIRPAKLIEARQQWRDGKLPREQLKALEDECIRDAVKLQERAGLQVITDGEFRKWGWRDLLIDASDGFSTDRNQSDFTFTDFSGEKRKGNSVPDVLAKIKRREMMAPGFEFVKGLTKGTVKATLPAPSCAHFFRGDKMLDKSPYKGDRKAYLADVAAIYRQEIADLAKQGCTYLQIDDVPSAVLCDPRNAAVVKERGEDPEKLIDEYYALFNEAVKDRPTSMALGIHLCRGNSGHGQGAGGYDPVAERLFNLPATMFFLEYDTERAGGFEPLRHLPKGKFAVLGIMSTKLKELEPVDEMERKVDQAAKFAPKENLCLSPQCGFASNYINDRFTADDEERKLTHLVKAAGKIWS